MAYSDEVMAAVREKLPKAALVDFSNLNVVLNNLIFMQQVITASERLLAEAVQESSGELQEYFIAHLKEERGHADWLCADLASHGVDANAAPRFSKAVAMAGAQYYLIKHVDPACLLGYMAVLEGMPASIELIETLENLHGKELFTTMRYHAENDLEHRKELFAIIDKIASPAIMANAVQTAEYLNDLTEFLKEVK